VRYVLYDPRRPQPPQEALPQMNCISL
jgi:hypothetical protein